MNEKELLKLHETRRNDRRKSRTRRFKQVHAIPESLGALLHTVLKGDTEAIARVEEQRALQAWERIVGDAAARVSEALRIRQGQLVVKVADPVWRQQLLLLKNIILKKYQQHFPKLGIRDIFFSAR